MFYKQQYPLGTLFLLHYKYIVCIPTHDRPDLSSERASQKDKTVTLKKRKKKSLVKCPRFGLDTKTYWLTDSQSQCDSDFEYSEKSSAHVHTCRQVVQKQCKDRCLTFHTFNTHIGKHKSTCVCILSFCKLQHCNSTHVSCCHILLLSTTSTNPDY
jgi:hypothetical protein